MPRTSTEVHRRARELRKDMTPQEEILWREYLHHCPWKFRRQMPWGRFILDFCCIPLHLVIEIDGAQHETPEGRRKDEARTAILQAYGYDVLRFSNRQIDENLEDVVRQIKEVCEKIRPDYQVTRRFSGNSKPEETEP